MRLMEQVAIMSDSDAACVVSVCCVFCSSRAYGLDAEVQRPWMAKGHRRPLPPVRLCKQL